MHALTLLLLSSTALAAPFRPIHADTLADSGQHTRDPQATYPGVLQRSNGILDGPHNNNIEKRDTGITALTDQITQGLGLDDRNSEVKRGDDGTGVAIINDDLCGNAESAELLICKNKARRDVAAEGRTVSDSETEGRVVVVAVVGKREQPSEVERDVRREANEAGEHIATLIQILSGEGQ